MALYDKLYLTNKLSTVTPSTLRATWDQTGLSSLHRVLDPRKIGGGVFALGGSSDSSATNPFRILAYRGVSLPLASDQTISGTVDAISKVFESNADMDAHWRMHLYVTVGDTDVVRGTLLNDYAETAGVNEWPTTDSGHQLASPQAMNPVAALAGDRIVVELGAIVYNSFSTFRTMSLVKGTHADTSSSAASDQVVGSTTTGAPYIQFSSSIDFDVLPQPSNDECSSPTTISAFPFSDTIDLASADETDTDDPSEYANYTHWCWYQVTPASDGLLKITALSPFSSKYVVFTGTCGSLTDIADSASAQDQIFVQSGTAYKIGIAATGRAAVVTDIDIDFAETPTKNTSFAQVWQLDLSGGNTGGAYQNPTGYYERSPYNGDTPDAAHPDVVSTEAVQIVEGAGPSGEDVIDYWQAPATSYDADEYSVAGVALAQFGPLEVPDSSLIEDPGFLWDADEAAVSFDYKFIDAALTDSSFSVLLILSNSFFENRWPMQFYLDEWDTDVYRFELTFDVWNDEPNDLYSRFFTRAELLALDWVNLRIEWKSGTPTGAGVSFTDVASDGYIRVWLGDEPLFDVQDCSLYWEFYWDGFNYGNAIWTGYSGMSGQVANLTLFGESVIAPVPPLQRAGYVLFSNDIVERQAETRLTRTYLQILTADPPATVSPDVLTLTEVTGDLYDQEGGTVTTGRLYITPRDFIVVGIHLIAKKTVAYDITGPISLNLAASDGVLYDVEYDPDPDDTTTPLNLKSGFWRDVWDIPAASSVDISDL